MKKHDSYNKIDRPYDNQLRRSVPSNKAGQPSFGSGNNGVQASSSLSGGGGGGGVSVKSGGMMGDMWIKTFIRSENWKPKERGFTINGGEGYAEFSNVYITGNLVASSGTIGGFTITDTQLYSITDGNKTAISSGDTAVSIGPEGAPTVTIMQSGLATFANIVITGGSMSGISIDGIEAGSLPSLQGWTSDLVFSATDYRTVAWTAGDVELADTTTFNILAGNTGAMAAITYIYLDVDVSTTTLQKSTTASDSVGAKKILIAVAQNNTDTTSKATFQAFGGAGGQFLTVDNIAANSASTNEFITNTAQIKDAVISSAKVASLVANKITAGTGIINSLSVYSTLTMGSAGTNGIIQSYGWNGTATGFRILGGSAPAVTVIGGTITGGIVQTKVDGYRVRMNGTSSALEFLSNDTIRGSIITSAAGDVIIAGVDDVLMSAGGSIRVSVASSSFKPASNGSYDLGASGNQWNDLFLDGKIDLGNYSIQQSGSELVFQYDGTEKLRLSSSGGLQPSGLFEASDGSDGVTGSFRIVTRVSKDGGNDLNADYRDVVFKNGIITSISGEGTYEIIDNVWHG